MRKPRSSLAMPARFYAESFAPWCERARWALDHHGISYREIEQAPLVAEVRLRLATRKPLHRATVPLLIDGPTVLMNSDHIARYAEQVGSGSSLFPITYKRDVSLWMELSEAIMTSGRALLLPRLAKDPAALREQLAPVVPRSLRPALQWVALIAVRHLMSKYGVRTDDRAKHEEISRHALDRLRAALTEGRSRLVRGAFSYADVTMAAALQFVAPVDQRYIVLGPATRATWRNARLAADYPDLLAWRDVIYAAHRRGHPGAPGARATRETNENGLQ